MSIAPLTLTHEESAVACSSLIVNRSDVSNAPAFFPFMGDGKTR
jgi:hypothetical protein